MYRSMPMETLPCESTSLVNADVPERAQPQINKNRLTDVPRYEFEITVTVRYLPGNHISKRSRIRRLTIYCRSGWTGFMEPLSTHVRDIPVWRRGIFSRCTGRSGSVADLRARKTYETRRYARSSRSLLAPTRRSIAPRSRSVNSLPDDRIGRVYQVNLLPVLAARVPPTERTSGRSIKNVPEQQSDSNSGA